LPEWTCRMLALINTIFDYSFSSAHILKAFYNPRLLPRGGFSSVPRLPAWSFQLLTSWVFLPPPHCPPLLWSRGPAASPTDRYRKDSTLRLGRTRRGPPVTSEKPRPLQAKDWEKGAKGIVKTPFLDILGIKALLCCFLNLETEFIETYYCQIGKHYYCKTGCHNYSKPEARHYCYLVSE
jgi:hypothetical protein